jgi:Domain of unknown function (DUF4276)
MKIVPIVEGHGEVEAVPVLLRRLAEANGTFVEVARPIRQPKGRLVKEAELRRAVALAAKQTRAGDGILVLLDADTDCPAAFGPRLLAWARAERADRRIAVVLANREFEAWFLAATTSLVAQGKLPAGTNAPEEPEAITDPKGWLSEAMGRRYSEIIDQPAFAARFDAVAARRCASFDKLVREFDAMVRPG